jgi:hypothetical protein
MASIAGNIAQGVRWIVDATGLIVGYRNPLRDTDETATFGSGGTWGTISAAISSSRALTGEDFAYDVIPVTAAAAITVPTVASLGLSSATKLLRLQFNIQTAGSVTFAGATSSTSLNGTAGTTTVTPASGAVTNLVPVVLEQLAVGGDAWILN